MVYPKKKKKVITQMHTTTPLKSLIKKRKAIKLSNWNNSIISIDNTRKNIKMKNKFKVHIFK